MNKKVLMVAFHFPPDASIGAQRAFKTAEYLPEFGWDPIVLTAKSSAYENCEYSQSIPKDLDKKIYRTIALDVHKHLSILGKHFEWMKIIDRWTIWIPGAIFKGRSIIKKEKPDIIWSTSPIPSAHIIARILSKQFNIPWVADYRDPFSYHHYPTTKIKSKLLKSIDTAVIKNCNTATFTTSHAMNMYQKYFKEQPCNKFKTVENGFDENNWIKLKSFKPSENLLFDEKKFNLFYTGVLYPIGRNPEPIFQALNILKVNKSVNRSNFKLIFQGSGDGKKFSGILKKLGIINLVSFQPSVSYLESLYSISHANALVLIQDKVFNQQIPGKLFEYIRSGKPILIVSPQDSATSTLAKKHPYSLIAESPNDIANHILDLISSKFTFDKTINIDNFSRRNKTHEFVKIFNQISPQ